MTKAQEVFQKTEALIAAGTPKAEAFKQLAQQYGQPVNSIRGSYYSASRGEGTGRRPRRRETTPEDAVADARAALERAMDSIDREVEAARERAEEAKREHEALKSSAKDRKEAIKVKLEALA